MTAFRARVQNGRLVIDTPTALPEGTVLDLVVDDEGDDLSDEERAALHDALRKSAEELNTGKSYPATDVLRDLQRGR